MSSTYYVDIIVHTNHTKFYTGLGKKLVLDLPLEERKKEKLYVLGPEDHYE